MVVKEIWTAAGEAATIVSHVHEYNFQWIARDEINTQFPFCLHICRLLSKKPIV